MTEHHSRTEDQPYPGTQDAAEERSFDAANTAASVARGATDRGLDMIQQSLRALSDLQRPALEVAHDQGRRTAEAVAQFTGACHKAAESTANDIHALTASSMQLGCGVHEWQHTWAGIWREATDRAMKWQHAVLSCRSSADLAQVQHRFFCDTISSVVDTGAELLRLQARMAESAAGPLRERARQHRD